MNPITLLAKNDPSVGLLVILGISVVFVGLVAIVGLVWAMNKVYDRFLSKKQTDAPAATAPVQAAAPANSATVENREEILAAVCAAVAEEEGVDVSALRVLSFKKL